MMIRNQNHVKESTKYEEYLYVQCFNYKYKESTTQLITELKLSKHVLLYYAFKKIFLKAYNLKSSCK